MNILTNIYKDIIFRDTYKNINNRLVYTLNLLSLAMYLKNLTQDTRSLPELALIIKEEYNL